DTGAVGVGRLHLEGVVTERQVDPVERGVTRGEPGTVELTLEGRDLTGRVEGEVHRRRGRRGPLGRTRQDPRHRRRGATTAGDGPVPDIGDTGAVGVGRLHLEGVVTERQVDPVERGVTRGEPGTVELTLEGRDL